jgi:hypothetical protein
MDQKIKNFDRGIEQMMNEHEVAPPFGMWNRISAELEAMPLPVAAAAPAVTSLIPKRAIAGIIASALIIGASIATGYMVHSSLNSNKNKVEANTKPISAPVTSTVVANNNSVQPVEPVKHEVTPALPVLAKAKVNHIADNPVQSTLQAAQQVNPVAVQPAANTTGVAAYTNSLVVNNSNTDVPTPIEPIAQNTEPQTYYFPPIDVNTPEKTKASDAPVVVKAHTTKVAAPVADNSDNSSPRKFKFPKSRRSNFSWPKINTNK